MIRTFACLLIFLVPVGAAGADGPRPPVPESVAVIYNTDIPESRKLAETYSIARQIPDDNLIGLSLPDREEISRGEYESLIRQPLVAEFDRRQWWSRKPDGEGNLQLTATRIQILVCMRGVPSRVLHPDPKPAEGAPQDESNIERMLKSGNASVDAELTLLGIDGLPVAGPLNNPYFKQDSPIATAGLPMMLAGRIDGPSFPVCEKMIRDAVQAEKTGLWGNAVIDIANKSAAGDPNGDPWLEKIARLLVEAGYPTLVDRFPDTLPLNFPLTDTALYFGWYDWHVNGPFKNPKFRFKPGAIAVHLHSFSAAQLRNPSQNWAAPLLNQGAAATLGNVYEPFLHLTHNFDIFVERLLKGYTLVEAAHMALPALSWQAVVLGDPLYRPFLRIDGSGERDDADALFRAFSLARERWGEDPAEFEKQLRAAAERMESGLLLELLGLDLIARSEPARAASVFREAKLLHRKNADKLRTDLLGVMLDREAKRSAAAIRALRDAKLRYNHLPEVAAVDAWLNILDPPPPAER